MSHVILAKRRSGGSYRVEFYRESGRLKIRCNCSSGSVGQMCRHKRAFISGNDTMLFDTTQSTLLHGILAWPEMQTLARRASAYEKAIEALEQKREELKKEEQVLLMRYASDCLDGVKEE